MMNGDYAAEYGGSGSGSRRHGGPTNGTGIYGNEDYNDAPGGRPPVGYGGLGPREPSGTRAGLYSQARPPDLERRRAHRRSRSRSAPGERNATKQIEEILEHIQREWGFMTEDKCVPVQVALQLLDDSSIGLASRASEFHTTHRQLQDALRAIVNENSMGFSSSIGAFHQIQSSIQTSHERVRSLRESLIEAKSNLSSAKPEWQNLAAASHNYASMLDTLHIMEQVQEVPEKLEANISEKHFLAAVDLLKDALNMIRKSEMEDIGALADMKVYLSNQEHSLTDILIEELHNHLYLKSPYCEDRWTNYSRIGREKSANAVLSEGGTRQLYDFLEQLDTSVAMSHDASRNPESDTFVYTQLLVESLNKLGRLTEAVDSIEQRLPVELFKVVGRTNAEVQQRHPNISNKANSNKTGVETSLNNPMKYVVLGDLLDVLYAKFEAIAEAHRAFHEVVVGVSKRESNDREDPNLLRGFKELWKLYQSEMRSLLHDYLSTGGDTASRTNHGLASEANIFRYQRDKNKKTTFKLDMVDPQSMDLKLDREEIASTWQKFVPGLVSLGDGAVGTSGSTGGPLDSSAAGHKLLVEPSVFNIGCLLPPSMKFLSRLKEIVPSNTDIVVESLSSFLNDFLINVFHPQLEETLTEFCSQSFIQHDAFQTDPLWQQYAQKPIFGGTVKFFDIVQAFCKMLDELTHDQLFTQLIITQMNTYYEKCSTWYKSLVTRSQYETDGRQLKTAASLAEVGDVCGFVTSLRNAPAGEEAALLAQEPTKVVAALNSRQLSESDLISDRKSLNQLCLLFSSMTWLSTKLSQLRKISEKATDSANRRNSSMIPIKRTLTTTLLENSEDDSRIAYLPLSSESAGFFDGIVDAYQELADVALSTLHLEARCDIFFRLGMSVKGSYLLSQLADSPDEDILALVDDVRAFDQEMKFSLQPIEYRYASPKASKDDFSRHWRRASRSATLTRIQICH